MKPGDAVECRWMGKWRPGRVLSVGRTRAKVEFFTPHGTKRSRVSHFYLEGDPLIRTPRGPVRTSAIPPPKGA